MGILYKLREGTVVGKDKQPIRFLQTSRYGRAYYASWSITDATYCPAEDIDSTAFSATYRHGSAT
jgi:hypothetical protein